ncbi:ATPase component of ABC transporter with duplicated ATPase domain protein [Rubidibacter lacunae KORDI 51-2]|uniref:ATPase component of ABC transporter with duplicated ATPase domain protein n=1 Tax=Rubidibacter lacunae KORDI 51-2 TaxID=582515 RepID=U5DM63_9CHRO|nr:ATP-binding cassette domain-containing protein [Rubidibacter lacunae]ERN41669.1 ATPase component of ABC transporter with duplicated ATPase domain protein [Rubidibacter lacunae KORDI 51-2]
MTVIRLENVSKIYPTGEVLRDVNWEVKAGDRVGLVGVNGAGKTTQLKIVMGVEEPTTGQVVRPASLRIAHLNQEFDVEPGRTTHEELWTVFTEANRVQHELARVQGAMASAAPDELERLIHELDRLQHQFESLDGYGLDARVSRLLADIGFEPDDSQALVSSFSGGWQMRMCLGKTILQAPDVLLLDEPTNHLDLETIEWLEGYLKQLSLPMVIVSHDREFLDRICTQIVETERGVSTTYLGNYSSYLEQKQLNREAQLSAYERQQSEIAKQQAFVERFRASATRSTQAKSREKQLEKIERIEAPDGDVKVLNFRFPPAPRSGLEVVKVEDLTYEIGDKVLFLGANLFVERGDRIAFLGPNGAGKSTLLRLIVGIEQPTDGTVALGAHTVIPGYFEQNQSEALDLDLTVLQTLQDAAPDWKYEDLRAMLGKFLFSGDTVAKPVAALSGGEKARLALAKMLLTPVNLLVLDEPTNHLDIPAKETLENALQMYEGTALIVSHDRYFISKVANKIVEIRDGELVVYKGDYHYYLEKVEQEKEQARLEAKRKADAAKRTEKLAKQKEKAKTRKTAKKKK